MEYATSNEYDFLNSLLSKIEKNIQNATEDYLAEHCEKIVNGNAEEKNFIFQQLKDIEKQKKKNLKKINDIKNFLYGFLS